jgi:subtilisin family serine protease
MNNRKQKNYPKRDRSQNVVTILLVVFTLALGLTSCAKKISRTNRVKEIQPTVKSPARFVPNEIVVRTDNDSVISDLKSEFTIVEIDKKGGVYLLIDKTQRGKEQKIIDELEEDSRIEFAQFNYLYSLNDLASAPMDSKWLEMWALKNYGQSPRGSSEGKPGADIKAIAAWKQARTHGNEKIKVAVIDTGIDYKHEDFQHANGKTNIWVNEAEKNGLPGHDDDGNGFPDDVYGWNFVRGDKAKKYHGQLGHPDPMDDHGHGTHCAGTIGAVGDNGTGITGINWQVSLIALKVLSASGSGNSTDIYRAIKYAHENGADVISMSFGGGQPDKLVKSELKRAEMSGALLVAAAGNDGTDNDIEKHYPSNYEIESLVSVAATDNRDRLAIFSNFGVRTVHIAAPGVGITSTYPTQLSQQEGSKQGPYRTWSGTSMATPHVAGAAALVLAADPTLKKKPRELKKRLLETADWMPHLSGKIVSGGRLNLLNAVTNNRENSYAKRGEWSEEACHLETPHLPEAKLDRVWKIRKPGAKSIQLHVRQAVIDAPFDVAVIYDSKYRYIATLSPTMVDEWLPPVEGDTVLLKFSNGIVAQSRQVPEPADKKTPPNGSKTCVTYIGSNTSGEECFYFERSDERPNFESESIQIDAIRYISDPAKSTEGSCEIK